MLLDDASSGAPVLSPPELDAGAEELLSPELVSSKPVLPPEVDPSAVGAGSLAHAVARRIATARRG